MKKRILLVDDEPTTVKILKRTLESQGYIVYDALNGREGIEFVNTQDVDLVITDIEMPEMDGIDMFKALKASVRTKNIPVIVVTADKFLKESFRKLGVNDFMAKPMDPNVILERVPRALKLKSRRFRDAKFLLIGNNTSVLDQMEDILEKQFFTVWKTSEGSESVQKALVMVPDFIVIDALLQDLSAREVIRSFRAFSKLMTAKILTYHAYTPDPSDIIHELPQQAAMERIAQESQDCLEAGADVYIGKFSPVDFLDKIRDSVKISPQLV